MKIFTSTIFLIAFSFKLFAQDDFSSLRLNNLFALLPLECKKALSQSTDNKCDCVIKGNNLPLKASFNNEGQLYHLGLNLFAFDANLIYPNSVLSFIERTYLEYFVWNDAAIIDKKNNEDKIIFLINDKKFNTPGAGKLTSIASILFADNKELVIKQDSLYCTVSINYNVNTLELKFPANYQLVSGMDKKEFALQLINRLKNYKTDKIPNSVVNYTDLLTKSDSVKVKVGKSYYKTISSNTYFKCLNGECYPVFDIKHPLESFTNTFLLTGDFNQNIDLSIEHKIYGNEKINYEISLYDFISFFINDHELYFGIENVNDKQMEGVLIIVNKQLNYINMLTVNTSYNIFLNNKKQIIKAKFYSNIPSDNIKNLFAE